MLVDDSMFEHSLSWFDCDTLVLDLETTGLNPDCKDDICGVALLNPYTGATAYYPFRHMIGSNLPRDKVADLVSLINSATTIIGHNIKFDLRFLYRVGLNPPEQIKDTMLGYHLLDENADGFSLKGICGRLFGKKSISGEAQLERDLAIWGYKKGDMWKLPPDKVAPYAIDDVKLTHRLCDWLLHKLAEEDQAMVDLWYEVSRFTAPISMMEHYGLHVNAATNRVCMTECKLQMGLVTQKIHEMSGKKINPNSPAQVSSWLKVQTTASAELRKMKSKKADMVLDYRAWSKMASSYYKVIADKKDKNDDLHPNLLLHGTYTGRLSCRSPNLQAIPRYDSVHKVKDTFVARPGYVMAEADYSQAEIRVASHFAKEKTMMGLLRSGVDIHSSTADTLGINRNIAKRLNFGVIYGIGAVSLAYQLDVPENEARSYLTKYHSLYPGFRRLYNQAESVAENRRYIRLYTGRRRHYGNDADFHKASSNLVQGTVAEMVRESIMRIWDELPRDKVRMILTVHDSILFEIKEGEKDDLFPHIKQIMEYQPWCSVPMPVDIKSGMTWSTMEDISV